MKLQQLHSLCAIVDAEFNISRAARALESSQPAIGKHIRALEQTLGVQLLLRSGKRITGLTEAGRAVLAPAREMLRHAANIRIATRDLAEPEGGELSIATTHTHARYMLLPSIKGFVERHPDVLIRLRQGTPQVIVGLVAQGTVDVGITTELEQLPAGLVQIPSFRMQHSVIAPVGHPLLKSRAITLRQLASYPLLAHDSQFKIGKEVMQKFSAAGLQPRFVMQALDSDVMKAYVSAGLGIAIIPKISFSPRRDSGLRSRDVSHLFTPTTTYAIFRRGVYLNKHVQEFIQSVAPQLDRKTLEDAIAQTGGGARVLADAGLAPAPDGE